MKTLTPVILILLVMLGIPSFMIFESYSNITEYRIDKYYVMNRRVVETLFHSEVKADLYTDSMDKNFYEVCIDSTIPNYAIVSGVYKTRRINTPCADFFVQDSK